MAGRAPAAPPGACRPGHRHADRGSGRASAAGPAGRWGGGVEAGAARGAAGGGLLGPEGEVPAGHQPTGEGEAGEGAHGSVYGGRHPRPRRHPAGGH